MNLTEYLKELNRIKTLAVNRWGNLDIVERQIFDASFEWLVDNLEIKRGEVRLSDEELSAIMDQFLKAVTDIVKENVKYQSILSQFVTDIKTLTKNSSKFYRTSYNLDIEKAGVNDAQKMFVDEAMNQYVGNGLNPNFATPLRNEIFRSVLTGANMKEIKNVLQAYIIGGGDKSGKLQQYLGQTAQQAVDTYSGLINQKLVTTFKFTGYIISGSLIETSSKQCIYAVETAEDGYLSFDDWEKVLSMARDNDKAKLIPGTTIKNLPINKLHWGCRHDFTPVIKKKKEKD